MLTIKKEQQQAFSNHYLKKFEDEMVEHVKEYFPNHFISMQEKSTRNTIQYAHIRAKKYDMITQRNVCLYLNNMLVLGSHFDNDPQYPWANEILIDKNINDPSKRADKLSDRMLHVFGQIRGERYKEINRALLNLHNNADAIFRKIKNSQLKDSLHILNDLYPKKFEVVGEQNLNQLIKLGKEKAAKYGWTTEPNIVMVTAFMFMSGAGFDNDPQFPWAAEILNDQKVTDQEIKMKLLFDKAIANLKGFLNQYNAN